MPGLSNFQLIRRVVKKIPPGKVSTYGLVAAAAGIADARQVGWAMRGNQDPQIPCHRVVNQRGGLALNYSLGTWKEQKHRLLAENVTFSDQTTVNLSKHLWLPK